MTYVAETQQPGETVVYSAKLHWVIYMPALGLVFLALYSVADGYGNGGLLFLACAGLASLAAYIQSNTTELAITDRRIIVKVGLIRRSTMEMNRSKVESVMVEQGILGRIFGYGTVVIKGTGGSFEPVPNVDRPLEFRNALSAR